MRFITITTVAARVALAMGAVLASDENPLVCQDLTPLCCLTGPDIIGGTNSLGCDTRESFPFDLESHWQEITYPCYLTYSPTPYPYRYPQLRDDL